MDLSRLFESKTTRRTFLRVSAAAGIAGIAGVGLGTYRPRVARATGTEVVFDASTLYSTSPVTEAVLFGWDNAAFPASASTNVARDFYKAERYIVPGTSDNIVVADVGFYGSVQYVPSEGKYKMWSYSGYYSESTDGFAWEPRTGFTIPDSATLGVLNLSVLYDPDDADPDRRYKMVYETDDGGTINARVAYSSDGINWTPSSNNPVFNFFFEPQGIMKKGDTFYVNGQASAPPRELVTYTSTDFEDWTPQGVGLSLDSTSPYTDQVHVGAALWDRQNIVIGIYDHWQEPTSGPGEECPNFPDDDACDVDINSALAYSYDGISFNDTGFHVQLSDDQGDPHDNPAITHGQGIMNIGDKTHYFFGPWHMANQGMRLATWDIDRLGQIRRETTTGPTAVIESAPLQVQTGPAQLHANVDLNGGGGGGGDLTFALLDGTSGSSTISGYSSGTISGSGYSQVVTWDGSTTALPTGQTFRIQATYGGSGPDDVFLFALYVGDRS